MKAQSNWFVALLGLTLAGCGGADVIVDVDASMPMVDGMVFADAPLTDMTRADMTMADMTMTDMTMADMTMADMGLPGEPGIVVVPTTGLSTSEMGGMATFTVVLATAPTADVVLALASSNPSEGVVSPASLTFTPTNWAAPQNVTVTGVDDATQDGTQTYTITTAAAVSSDPGYDGLDADDVDVSNIDDETAGVLVTPTDGLMTSEAGGSDTFSIVLFAEPTADVTITFTDAAGVATVSPASVVFTPLNWASAQIVTVTGVDNATADGNAMFTIITSAAMSSDANYNGLAVSDVSGVNTDDESAGVLVSAASDLTTTEAGGTAMFTVALQSMPSANVTLSLTSSDTTEGVVETSMVSFTPVNWDVPQAIIVTGVDDVIADGDQVYVVTVGPATSADPNYMGLPATTQSIRNADDESAGFVVSPSTGLVTTEGGGTATFTVVLRSQPTASVTFALTSSDAAEGIVSPANLTFTTTDWDAPQTVTVTGVEDSVADGDHAYGVLVAVSASADASYAALSPRNVDVTNTDNESPGITVTPTTGLMTSEAGGTAAFAIVLNSQPLADVTVSLSSDVPAEGSVSPASVTFTTMDWNVPQTVTVMGADDAVADGARVYHVITAAAVSTDGTYNGRDASDVAVTNTDNDVVGVTVTAAPSLTTNESGGTATFTVVLTSEPSANVTIPFMSSDSTESSVSPASVVFTSSNWNVAQTVTVTGVDDHLVDGDIAYSVLTLAATSTDAAYNAFNAADVSLTNTDDDVAAVTVTPTSGLATTEAGGVATFTVVLVSQPSANVSIALSVSDATEASLGVATLTFTSSNWNTPQTVSVTGVDDMLVDGDVAYSVVTGATVSTDPAYSGVSVADVALSNADNDAASVIVTPSTGLNTTEAGGTATFTIVLTSQPTADVGIALTSNDTTEGSVFPATVTFTAANWNVPQTVSVTGVNDALDDGNVLYTIVTGATTSTDSGYNGLVVSDVTVTNADDDTSGVTVTPTSGLVTTEAMGTATFTIVLTAQPTANVTIAMSSSNTAEGTVTPSVTFTSANWNTPAVVTVTGANDFVIDGSVAYTIVTANATSADANYSGMAVADVSVSNTDNDVAGVTLSATAGLVTTEAGGTAAFTIVLTSQPTANVSIALSSSNTAEATVSPASVTFSAGNWSTPQTVTVTGVDDALVDGNIVYTIVTGNAVSTDSNYSGRVVSDVSATNNDNDVPGVTVSPTSGLVTTEAGGTATFTMVLSTAPTGSVTIGLSSSNAAEGTVSPATIFFNPGNWNVVQTVTVTGVDDGAVDGSVAYTIVTAAAVSTDGMYNGRTVADVTVTNTDNDVPGVTVSPTSGLVTTEALGTATFTLVLTSQPTANVVVGLSSSNVSEGTVSPASITFNSGNWNTPQTVTVTGVNDAVVDGNVAYTILTAAATSTDPNYNGRVVPDVSVTNTDNDTAGVTVVPSSGLVTTEAGGTASFTIVLTSQPTGNVAIALSSSNIAEGTVSPASVTFTSGNWNAPQSVTVTGINDFVDDSNVAYTIVTGNAVSSDGNYSGLGVSDVSVTNTDDDAAGVTVSPTSGLTTTEAGSTATFTIVLTSQPTAPVSIALVTSDATEGSVSPASVTFTTANWNVAQTVIVTGVDDAIADGNIAYTIFTSTAMSTDAAYNALAVSDVSVTTTDNDMASVTVTPTNGLFTTESGGTATFTIVLGTMPTASVSISLTSSNTAEGTVSPASVTFTTGNWNVAQTVTVTGVADAANDGNVQFGIVTGASTSTDGSYNMLAVPDVSVINLSSRAQQAYVKASNTRATDGFGSSITMSSDGNTMAISATGEGSTSTGVNGSQMNGSFGQGAVYVFTRSAGTWSQQAYVKASNTGSNDFFGTSVRLSGDGNTLAVGAAGEDSNATGVGGSQADNSASNSGAVYVFTRTGVVWSQQAYVKASNTNAGDGFGISLALSSDGSTLAVGANREDSSATGVGGNQADNATSDAGAVYVFTRAGVVWSQQSYVKATNPGADDQFGWRVALSGDGNMLAVSAPNEDSNAIGIGGDQTNNVATDAGAVYTYTRSGGIWSSQAYIKASNTNSPDVFGYGLDLSSDGSTLAVGARDERSNATGIGGNQADNSLAAPGAVYVFTQSAGVWSQQVYIKASNTDMNDSFGTSVALSSDGSTLAVGAYGEASNAVGVNGDATNNSATIAGAVYTFARFTGIWRQISYVKASNTATQDSFGSYVALSADGLTLAVTSYGEDSNATGVGGNQADNSASGAGAAYVFIGN